MHAKLFRNGREVTAWVGVVPRQSSSGGKPSRVYHEMRGSLSPVLVYSGSHDPDPSFGKQNGSSDSWSGEAFIKPQSLSP
nr:IS110 family transposase [Acidithiobacillus ferruginosus]